MGYYTYFTILVKEDPKNQAQQLVKDVRKLRSDAGIKLGCAFEDTWYDYAHEMTELSRKYPEMLISMIGEGETNDDIWEAYFRNGKHRKLFAEIKFQEFNTDTFTPGHKLLVITDDDAIDEYARSLENDDMERRETLRVLEEDGTLLCRYFRTESEKESYIQGLNDSGKAYLIIDDDYNSMYEDLDAEINLKLPDGQKKAIRCHLSHDHIPDTAVPPHLFRYSIRHADNDFDNPATLEEKVTINHKADVITDSPLYLKDERYFEIESIVRYI